MADVEPAGGENPDVRRHWEGPGEGGAPRGPAYRPVKWATDWTGISRRTVHRRLDAWHSPHPWIRMSPYAIRGTRRANSSRDRVIDPVDAERVRLQEAGLLNPEVTTAVWDQMIAEGRVPLQYVTNEEWFQKVIGVAPEG